MRYQIEVEPQEARQRFALVAENVGQTPWRWQINDLDRAGLAGHPFVVGFGDASFKATGWLKARLVVAWRRHEDRIESRSRARMNR